MSAFYLSVGVCMPYIATMTMVGLLFALLCRDLYSDKPLTKVGNTHGKHHFIDFATSWTTIFRLFVGEGWQVNFTMPIYVLIIISLIPRINET